MKKIVETKADAIVKECLAGKQSFSMIAGAGSGKTTSLITALQFLRDTEGKALRRDDKKIVCITYTNRAVDVISSRLQFDDLFEVSTLHSFLWNQTKRFTPNIKQALRDHIIPNHIAKKREDDNGGKSKKANAARERVAELEMNLAHLEAVPSFKYNETNFSSYLEGLLGHDDVIDVAAYLLLSNSTLQRVVGQKYPYIFVDEAQDTFSNVVEALNKLCENNGLPIVGYFGDPMQQIYEKRAGNFAGPIGSNTITKEENYRCSVEVINLLNAFRKDVQQFPAGKNSERKGSVKIRLVKAEEPAGERKRYTNEQVGRASERFDEALKVWGWQNNKDVKQLFLVRQMIARRLGFTELHKLFTGDYASSKAQEDYEKGVHFLLKPFVTSLCYLVRAKRVSDGRRIIDILRKASPAFDPNGPNAKAKLKDMITLSDKITDELVKFWEHASIGEILRYCEKHMVCDISDRLSEHLHRNRRTELYDADVHEGDKGDWLADNFLGMKTLELDPFVDFVNENTPMSTQHGVKGEEYNDVVVVFDDVDAGWNNYSFTKMLTPATSGEPTEGQYEKSNKLAYVCFSRAEENLRVLLFTPNPAEASKELIATGLFTLAQIEIAE